MVNEFIVECTDGMLYHITDEHPLFSKRTLTCKPLKESIGDLDADYCIIVKLLVSRASKEYEPRHENLKVGLTIEYTQGDVGGMVYSRPILKVFQRIR